jgi:hypothetical protein
MNRDTTPEQQQAIVQQAINALMEHFDCVQILASSHGDDGTSKVAMGGGNWYARQGMAHEFIQMDQAQTNAHQMASVINPPDNEGEAWKAT